MQRLLRLFQAKYLVTDLEVEGEAYFELFHFDGSSVWQMRDPPLLVSRHTNVLVAANLESALGMVLAGHVETGGAVVITGDDGGMEFGQAPGSYGADSVEWSSGYLKAHINGSTGEVLATPIAATVPWTIEVDGSHAEPLRVNACFLGVLVPPGDHLVTFRFDHTAIYAGACISLATVLLLALFWAAPGLIRRDQ